MCFHEIEGVEFTFLSIPYIEPREQTPCGTVRNLNSAIALLRGTKTVKREPKDTVDRSGPIIWVSLAPYTSFFIALFALQLAENSPVNSPGDTVSLINQRTRR